MSTHISGGSLGFALAPLVFAPAIVWMGRSMAWFVAIPGLIALTYTLRLIRKVPIPRKQEQQGWRYLRPYAKPLALLYFIVVLRTLTANSLSVFLPVLLTQQGMGVGEASAAVSFYLFLSTVGGFLGGPLADAYGPRRVIIWTLLASVPFLLARPAGVRLDADAADLRRRIPPAVDPADQRDVRATTRAGQRRDGVVADDGLRVGCRVAARAGCRGRRRCLGTECRAVDHGGRPGSRGAFALPLPNRAPAATQVEPAPLTPEVRLTKVLDSHRAPRSIDGVSPSVVVRTL